MTRRKKWAAAALAAATVAAVGGIAWSAGATPFRASNEADKPALEQTPKFEANDGPTASKAQQALAERITSLSVPSNGQKTDALGVPVILRLGIVGFTGAAPEGYTMITGAGADVDALRQRVLTGLPAEAAESLTIKQSDVSTSALTAAWTAIAKAEWRTTTSSSWSMDLDPASVKILVTVSKLTDEETAALRKAGNGLVTIKTNSTISRASRTYDLEPHWGGARITRQTVACSAGWTARGKSTGTLYSVTTGHCGSNGTHWSSTVFYGELTGKEDYPDYDQARLKDSTYTNRLYTDGQDNFDTRKATSAKDGYIGDRICQSGATSGSICGIRTLSFDSRFCDEAGCTTYLGRGIKDNATAAQGGDSGGPVYYRNTELPRADIRGITVAGGYEDIWWERYASISNHLNVTAVVAD